MDWMVGGLLIVAGIVAGWFVSKDAANFVLAQGMAAIVIFVLLVAILAFWPARWTHLLKRSNKPN